MVFWVKTEGWGSIMADTLPEAEGKTPARVDKNLIKLEAKSVMLERRQKGENITRGKMQYMLFLGDRRKI